MKYEDFPRLIRREQAGEYVSCPQLLAHMEAAKWIKPTVCRNRMVLFDRRKLDECIDRLNGGDYPSPPSSS
jgi:hypothetical protein